MDFHKYSFLKNSLYAKRYQQKWKWDVLWVYRNLSRHATWHQWSYQIALIKARKSKSAEQYYCKLFFRLDGTWNSMVELSNSTGWDFDSTIKFNSSTGEEHCEWFVCGVCGTEVAFDLKQELASQFLLFFSWDQKAAVGSLLRMEVILANTSLLLNTLKKKNYLMK